mmetsp:Transcript_18113/g.42644  ORF Transcript_18113/g.42644 Transcript_18113/m.42644 type:complete len:293 (-) Transcript_18113:16-894(-)
MDCMACATCVTLAQRKWSMESSLAKPTSTLAFPKILIILASASVVKASTNTSCCWAIRRKTDRVPESSCIACLFVSSKPQFWRSASRTAFTALASALPRSASTQNSLSVSKYVFRPSGWTIGWTCWSMPTMASPMLTITLVRFPSFCHRAGTRSMLFNTASNAIKRPSSSKICGLSTPTKALLPSSPCRTTPGTNSTTATYSLGPLSICAMKVLCPSTIVGAWSTASYMSEYSSCSSESTRLRATRTPTKSATSSASVSATAAEPCGFTTTASLFPSCTSTAPPEPPEHHMV